MERRYRNISGIDGVKTVMTYNEAFPLWVAEVYRNHGYEPDTWYGSEVAEKMHKEALATYKGPPATMLDYVEAIPSEEEFEYLDYAIQQLRKDNINLNALPDKERWAVMDRIIAEYAEHKNTHTSRAKQVQKTSMQAALEEEREALAYLSRIEKSLKEQGFSVSRAGREDIKRLLAVYYEQNVTTEKFEDFDGERWIIQED